MELLHRGNQNRTVEPTKRNETSSRSHAVLQIVVERETKTAGISSTVVYGEWEAMGLQLAVLTRASGKLSLIDLAGSERASSTENTGQRLLEGANINRSLLALANCINALAVEETVHKPSAPYVCCWLVLTHFFQQPRRTRGSASLVRHVPFRDSKLTRILKARL